MFKNEPKRVKAARLDVTPPPRKSAQTRQRIVTCALALFRKRGFDATTMRDIAAAADLSLGAAYYYFASKEAIVLAYYARTQEEHAARVLPLLAPAGDLRARLGVVIHGKLDLLAGERKLLGALFRLAGDPDDPLSVFAKTTGEVRAQSIALFDAAIGSEPMPADLRAMVALGLWLFHLGVLLFFIHDRSARQSRTRRLVDGALDLAIPLIRFAASPVGAPLRERLLSLLRETGTKRRETP